MDYGQKVIRSLENSTPASQTQDTQPFSPSASQTLAVPSTVPSESRETDIYDEAPIHLADIAIKIERVTQDLSPKTSDNKDLNNSYEYDSEAQALLLKGKIFLRNVRLVVESWSYHQMSRIIMAMVEKTSEAMVGEKFVDFSTSSTADIVLSSYALGRLVDFLWRITKSS